MKHKKIAFIGMMGCGKSTIAKALADLINIGIYDLDILFERKNKISIREYFDRYSEKEFRKAETELLKEIAAKDNFIIATGGGIILSEENRNILFNKDIYTIYLKAQPQAIFNRIKDDTSRPLLMVENPKEEIEKILNQRVKFYSMADKTIDTTNKDVSEIIKEIQCIL